MIVLRGEYNLALGKEPLAGAGEGYVSQMTSLIRVSSFTLFYILFLVVVAYTSIYGKLKRRLASIARLSFTVYVFVYHY